MFHQRPIRVQYLNGMLTNNSNYMSNTNCYVRIEDGSLPVELLVQSALGQEETIIKFYEDIFRGYAEVKRITNGFELVFRKEPPENTLWSRIDRHPFLLNNPNKQSNLIIP